MSSLAVSLSMIDPILQPDAEPFVPTSELQKDISTMKIKEEEEEEEQPPLLYSFPLSLQETICAELEFYFSFENLQGDLFLLKNMNPAGYVKAELLAGFGRIQRLTSDLNVIVDSLEFSTKLLLNEDGTMIGRKDPLPVKETYHGKLARTAIAYNLPVDTSIASLRELFSTCGVVEYLRLLKKNGATGRNAVLKPPIECGETYAIVEFTEEEMAKHAVLTVSKPQGYNGDENPGIQVVLFDGTNCEKLKERLFPVNNDRRRAKSASCVNPPSTGRSGIHVNDVGEGLDDMKEGRVETGIVYSIRGAGGLINPTRQNDSCISFRLVPDENGFMNIKRGDYVSFTVGKNKKSGRKYASRVKLEFRAPTSYSNSDRQNSFQPATTNNYRNRSHTVGAAPPAFKRSISTGQTPFMATNQTRARALSPGSPTGGSSPYRQALGPDGTRGFGARAVVSSAPKKHFNRSRSSSGGGFNNRRTPAVQ